MFWVGIQTMVGDTPEFDYYTDSFRVYWEDNSALANSILVYNTGRSVGAVVGLLEQKGGKLAMPDVLITAVGTKVSQCSRSPPRPNPGPLSSALAHTPSSCRHAGGGLGVAAG
jgi:hypothetical protein